MTMGIPLKLIENYNLSEEAKYLLILSIFYKHNLITKQKLLAQFKTLRDGSFLKKRNTHHLKLADISVWDNQISAYSNLMNELCYRNELNNNYSQLEISFEDLLDCVKLYLLGNNKNHNYCVDYVYYEYLCNMINYKYVDWLNTGVKIYDLYDAQNYGFLRKPEYCCEYCCGDYNSYIERTVKDYYEIYVEDTKEEVSIILLEKINKLKK